MLFEGVRSGYTVMSGWQDAVWWSVARLWPVATFRYAAEFGRFSNRPFRVKRLQTIRRCSVDVAHGLVLLFGIGT